MVTCHGFFAFRPPMASHRFTTIWRKTLGDRYPVFGLNSPGVLGEPIPDSLEGLAERLIAEMKSVQPDGPYNVMGYCSGGTLAMEICRQLLAAGDDVGVVTCVETYNWATAKSTNPSLSTRIGYELERCQFLVGNFLLLPGAEKAAFLKSKWDRVRNRIGVWSSNLRSMIFGGQKKGAAITSNSVDMAWLWSVHDLIAEKYQPQHYPGRLLMLRPRRDYASHSNGADLSADHFDERRLIAFPAGTMSNPFVEEIAAIIRREFSDQRSFAQVRTEDRELVTAL